MAFAFCSSQNNMLLSFFLLFFFIESTVALTVISPTTTWPSTTTSPEEMTSQTTQGELPPVKLMANPDYAVAAGQKVNLHCTTSSETDSITWCWERLKNQTWQMQPGSDKKDLTLTEPKQSGIYRCCAFRSFSRKTVSNNHTVQIVSMHTTGDGGEQKQLYRVTTGRKSVGESLGIAAFVLSLLGMMVSIAILFWLGWQRLGDTLTISNTAAKGFPGPEKSPKGGLPKADDGDVYMNYTGTNTAYSDLDPNNMTRDNVYSSLS